MVAAPADGPARRRRPLGASTRPIRPTAVELLAEKRLPRVLSRAGAARSRIVAAPLGNRLAASCPGIVPQLGWKEASIAPALRRGPRTVHARRGIVRGRHPGPPGSQTHGQGALPGRVSIASRRVRVSDQRSQRDLARSRATTPGQLRAGLVLIAYLPAVALLLVAPASVSAHGATRDPFHGQRCRTTGRACCREGLTGSRFLLATTAQETRPRRASSSRSQCHARNAMELTGERSGDHVHDAEPLQRVDHLADDFFLRHGSSCGERGYARRHSASPRSGSRSGAANISTWPAG